MSQEPRLPLAWQHRVNELFMYEVDQVNPRNEPLIEGDWIGIYFEQEDGAEFKSGGMAKLRRLFCEGMDCIAQEVASTDILGVYGQTRIHEIILRRTGFEIGYSEDYGRIAYMRTEELLRRPWHHFTSRKRAGPT